MIRLFVIRHVTKKDLFIARDGPRKFPLLFDTPDAAVKLHNEQAQVHEDWTIEEVKIDYVSEPKEAAVCGDCGAAL